MTVRNTTVRCGHLSLSRVASRNKTFLSLHGNGKGLQEEERYEKKEREKEKEREEACRGASRGGMPRMLSHRLLPPSSYRSLFHRLSSLLVHLTHSRLPSLSLFMDLFRLSLAALDIFTASCRRVDLVCITPLLLRGPLAVHPPKLSRRHDLCFLRPSGGLIPFCCRMYTCSGGALSPLSLAPSPYPSLPRVLARAQARISRTRLTVPARHAVDGLRVLARFGFFRDFFSALLSPSPASSPFLPLTALYRLVTSVSRARDLRASAPGQATIECYHRGFPCSEIFKWSTVMNK